MNPDEHIIRYNCIENFIFFLLYIIIGHSISSLISIQNSFMRNPFIIFLICISYLLLEIANFFLMFYLNLLMLILYIKKLGFLNFIYHFSQQGQYTIFHEIFYKFLLFILHLFFGGIFYILFVGNKILDNREINRFNKTLFVLLAFIFLIIFFPIQFLINLNVLLILIILRGHREFIMEINDLVEESTGTLFVRVTD